MKMFARLTGTVAILALLVGVGTYMLAPDTFEDLFADARDRTTGSAIRIAAANARRDLPRDLNEGTTLVDVQAEGQVLVFLADISMVIPPAAHAEFAEANADALRRQMCSQDRIRALFRTGISFRYDYRDATGMRIAQIPIDSAVCAQ